MGGFQISLEFGDYIGIFGGDVVLFGDVFIQIVQLKRFLRGLPEGLVVAPTNRLLKIVRKKFPV